MQAQSKCNTTSRTPIKIGNHGATLRGTVLDVRRKPDGILQRPPAIALAVDVLAQAEALGCEEILVSVEEGPTYRATLENFKAKSFPIQRGNFEPQRALHLSAWVADLHIESRALRPGEIRFRSPAQLAMF